MSNLNTEAQKIYCKNQNCYDKDCEYHGFPRCHNAEDTVNKLLDLIKSKPEYLKELLGDQHFDELSRELDELIKEMTEYGESLEFSPPPKYEDMVQKAERILANFRKIKE